MASDSGTGTTLTFSGITYELRGVTWDGFEVPEIDLTHMASTARTFTAGDIPDYGAVSAAVLFDASHALPTMGDSQTLTIDPAAIGATNTYTGTAFLQSMSVDITMEGEMTADLRFKFEGAVTKA
jgi:hypothetical protein